MLRNDKGFTLLEIIIALTILAGGILMLIQMFSGSINQGTQADRYQNAVYLAQQKFSQMEMEQFPTETTEGSFENLEGYHWQLEVLPYESPLNNEDARIQIQKISLRVFWEDLEQEKEVRLVTLNIHGKTRTAPADTLQAPTPTTTTAQKAPTAPKIKNLNPLRLP